MPVAFKSLQNAYIKCENPNIDLIDKQQAFSKPLFTERVFKKIEKGMRWTKKWHPFSFIDTSIC